MFDLDLLDDAAKLLGELRAAGFMLASAESCTGGLVAAVLTAVPGSSDVVERGFVTYSNEAKIEVLGVAAEVISAHGAVSPQVAEAMAAGALENSRAHVAVSVTGVAGPGGGSAEKPVGLVYLGGVKLGSAAVVRECRFGDIGRNEVRMASVKASFELVRWVMRS